MKTRSLLVYVALVFSMVFWGFSFIWTKMVLVYYNPITIIFFRLIISVFFLWILNYWLKRLQKLQKEDVLLMVVLSFLQPFLYFIGESYGLVYVSSTVASVVISTIPLFTPIAAFYFFKEKLLLMNFMGILISIGGVLLVIMKDDFFLSASPLGIMLLFLAVLSAIAYSVVLVKLSGKYNVYSIITYQNAIGIALFFPVFLVVDWSQFVSTGIHIEVFWPVIGLAFFASSLAFIFFTHGVQKLGVTKANTFTNTIPVFTAFFAYFILGETLSLLNIFGIFLVIAGLSLSQLKRTHFARTKNFFVKIATNNHRNRSD